MGNCTYQKIAKLANVAVSTVSKALSGSKEVSEETVRLVHRVALCCGYFEEKRRQRRALFPDSVVVSVLVPEIDSTEYARTAELLCRLLENRGATMNLHVVGFDPLREQDMMEKLQTDSLVDGMINCGSHRITTPLAIPMVQLTAAGEASAVDKISRFPVENN